MDVKESTRLGITQFLIVQWEEFSRYVFPVDITHLDGSYLVSFSCLFQLTPRTLLHCLNVEFLLASVGILWVQRAICIGVYYQTVLSSDMTLIGRKMDKEQKAREYNK